MEILESANRTLGDLQDAINSLVHMTVVSALREIKNTRGYKIKFYDAVGMSFIEWSPEPGVVLDTSSHSEPQLQKVIAWYIEMSDRFDITIPDIDLWD